MLQAWESPHLRMRAQVHIPAVTVKQAVHCILALQMWKNAAVYFSPDIIILHTGRLARMQFDVTPKQLL